MAEELLEGAVAARDAAVAQEDDADHRVVEDQRLAFARGLQLGLGALLRIDVIDDPDRAARGIGRVDQGAGEMRPE